MSSRVSLASLSAILVGAALGGALLTGAEESFAQVGLDPMVIQTEVGRGQAQSVLTVTNPSNQPMRVRLYAEPFTYDRDAGFASLLEDENDLSPYLQFSPREFVVPAGQRQRVRVVGILPPSLPESEYRAVIFTEALPEGTSTSEYTAGIQTRIGSTVYFHQPGAKPVLSVVTASVDMENDLIALLVSNAGESTARPKAKWTLRQGSETVATGESSATTVIEGGDRTLQLPYDVSSLPSGNYELSGELVWLSGTKQQSQDFSTSFSVQ